MADKPMIPDFPTLPDFGQMITQACEVVASVRGIPYDFNGALSLENKFVVLFKTVKEMFDAQDELVKSYKALHDFINQYFSNLDVQNEVNKKIEAMKESGELLNLLKPTVSNEVSAWLTANITNPSNPPLDKSLTVENAAAESKTTGEKIKSLQEDKVGPYLTITSSEQLSSLADAEPNRIYLIGIDKPDTLPDFPSKTQYGTLVTFNHKRGINDGTIQIFGDDSKKGFYIRQSWQNKFGEWMNINDATDELKLIWDSMLLYITEWISLGSTPKPPYDDVNTFKVGSIVSGDLNNVKNNNGIKYGIFITLGAKKENYGYGAIQIGTSKENAYIRTNFGGWGNWINLNTDVSNFITYTDIYKPNISMFENIGVVGDSYSSGGMVMNGKIVVNYGLSFPQVLKRQTGVNFVNYSFAGATCKTWLTNTSYGLSKVKSETKKQLYCICLGINDADRQETQPTGTIDDIKENYNDNPNTFFGNMGKIISEIQEYSPKSKILIFGIPKKQSQYIEYNGYIKQIANKFNLPYINTMSNRFISSDEFQNNMSGGHPLAVGYSRMAVAIKELIEKELLNSYFNDYTGDV